MKKSIFGFLILIGILIIGAVIFLSRFKNKSLPDYNEDISLSGLTSEVSVYRDSLAVPHVFASNAHDLYMAVGYTMAQDRLWQMDLLRRVTQGRLAEIFGNDMVDYDQLMRSLRMTKKSQRIISQANPELKEALTSFCSGVNQFIEQHPKTLPFEFSLLGYTPEPWLPEHSINLVGYMAWDLSTGWPLEVMLDRFRQKLPEELFRYLVPDMAVHNSYVFPDFSLKNSDQANLQKLTEVSRIPEKLGLEVFLGSNNWAVSGSRTLTGKPLLANDMHLSLNIPGIWYQMHQVIDGSLNVTGVVLPGQPMVIAGHNDSIAWGFTNVMVDDVDFYEEKINPNNPKQYLYNGEWKNLQEKEEMILVKGGDTIFRTNRFTHRGPMVSWFKEEKNRELSMHWLGNEESNEVLSVYLLNRAKNWKDFRNALQYFVAVNQNAVYADVNGNIGLQSTIGIPIRKADGWMIYPGETDEYDWKGLVPFEELPYTYNPESGYVVSANCRTVGDDYPYYISMWYDLPYRQDRIKEMIQAKDKLSVEDFQLMQNDQRSKMAEKFMGHINRALRTINDGSDVEAVCVNLLSHWDYQMDAKKAEALIFDELYYEIAHQLAIDQLGEELTQALLEERTYVKNFMENTFGDPESSWWDDTRTVDVKENETDCIVAAFRQVITKLAGEEGADPKNWKWGDRHQITLKHPMSGVKMVNRVMGLSKGPYRVGGSFHTVSPYSYPYGDPKGVNHGASERHIFDLADWNHSLTVIPTGTSGIPASDYYCDQTDLYINKIYHEDYVSRKLVEGVAKYRMKYTK